MGVPESYPSSSWGPFPLIVSLLLLKWQARTGGHQEAEEEGSIIVVPGWHRRRCHEGGGSESREGFFLAPFAGQVRRCGGDLGSGDRAWWVEGGA